jgi:CubicO group peptidase (beta-lactamase class C family)
MVRRLKSALPVALLSCAVLAAVGMQARGDTTEEKYLGQLTFSAEEEAEYLQRYELSRTRRRGSDLYHPRAEVKGAPDWAPLPSAGPDERTISEEALSAAAAYAAANNSSALIVWRNGRIEAETYFGDHSRDSLVNSYSLAKPLSSLAVGRAMQLGLIASLDQPVADFVPEWRDDPRRSKILLRHLLDMRPGFLRQLSGSGPDEIMSRSFLHPRSEDILIGEYPVVFEPGVRYEYNNAAYAMIAIVLQRATGRPYEEFVGTEILEKIGARGGLVWVNREGGVAQSGCCMLFPADTYLRLGLLTLGDGTWEGERLVPEGYVDEMQRGTEANPYYGLGAFNSGRYIERRGWGNHDLGIYRVLHSEPYLAADLYLFDGNMNQVVYMIPSQDMVVLRTGRMPPRSDQSEWDNSYLPNTLMRGIIREKGVSRPQPR